MSCTGGVNGCLEREKHFCPTVILYEAERTIKLFHVVRNGDQHQMRKANLFANGSKRLNHPANQTLSDLLALELGVYA